jgi:hypothetical protein
MLLIKADCCQENDEQDTEMPMKRNPKTNKISQLKLKTDEENEAKN